MSKEAYYFSHDANARHDPKILAMRSEYGINGYGIYWIIIEMLREQDNFKLPVKKYVFNAIAMQVQCKDFAKDDAKSFVENCINEYELFVSDGEFFWSNSLVKRMDKKNELSEKRRAAAKARWQKDDNSAVRDDEEKNDDANAMQNNANAMQDDARKGNKIKGNKKEIKTTTTENDTTKISKFWDENGFGFNNTNAKLTLLTWLDEPKFKEPGPIILKALEIAGSSNKRTLKYTEGILNNWFKAGCETLGDVITYQSDYEQGINSKQSGDKWKGLA